jgi:hypothetical protein
MTRLSWRVAGRGWAHAQEGCTVLYRAANFGQADMVHELLMNDAMDVNAATADGCTPLFIAVNYGYADVVQQLLTHKKLDVNQPHVNGCTPLFRAAASGQSEVLSALLAHEDVAVRASPSQSNIQPYPRQAAKTHGEAWPSQSNIQPYPRQAAKTHGEAWRLTTSSPTPHSLFARMLRPSPRAVTSLFHVSRGLACPLPVCHCQAHPSRSTH